MRPRDYFTISAYAFALSVLWNSLGPIILPILVLQYVPEALKNTSLSVLTFSGMVLAIFIQPAAGAIAE
ncbi:MAG: hypothetical protein EXR62_18240 [Chloroflexi bacterium]|nr:hypothetical protein [Chloroflexota bacterium]